MIRPQLLGDMSLVVTLYRRQSFSGAAKDLGVATSSFSRRIAAFEQELGLRLIDRTTRRFAFTPHGTAYAREAARVVDEAERVHREFQSNTQTLAGEVRIAVPQIGVVNRRLSAFIARFAQEQTGMTFHVESSVAPAQALTRDCEIAITAGIPAEGSMIVRKIDEIGTGVFASRAYLERSGRPAHPQDLRTLNLLTVEGFDHTWRLRRDGATYAVPLVATGTCNSFSVAEDLLAAGYGVAVLPRGAERGADVEVVLPEWRPQAIPIYFVTSSRLITARAKLFVDMALDHFRSAAA